MTKIILGDALEKMRELEENSVDTIITDPPSRDMGITRVN